MLFLSIFLFWFLVIFLVFVFVCAVHIEYGQAAADCFVRSFNIVIIYVLIAPICLPVCFCTSL